MKFGKKFLSLLMGVAVLCVSILPAFAADVDITPELEHRKSGYVERKRRPYQGNVVRIA